MDTSKEYISMCDEAKKTEGYFNYLTENWSKLRPLFIFDKLLDRVSIAVWFPKTLRDKCGMKKDEHIISIEDKNEKFVYIPEGTEGEVIPLLRQDQLQEMDGRDFITIMNRFIDWYKKNSIFKLDEKGETIIEESYLNQFNSFEQLWLAFVMKEKYNKVWDGKDWENYCEHEYKQIIKNKKGTGNFEDRCFKCGK